MKLLEVFYTDEPVIDKWTFVFDETNPINGYFTMLATSETGRGFSQWTEGMYEPGGNNDHLGNRPDIIGPWLVEHVIERMSDEP